MLKNEHKDMPVTKQTRAMAEARGTGRNQEEAGKRKEEMELEGNSEKKEKWTCKEKTKEDIKEWKRNS